MFRIKKHLSIMFIILGVIDFLVYKEKFMLFVNYVDVSFVLFSFINSFLMMLSRVTGNLNVFIQFIKPELKILNYI